MKLNTFCQTASRKKILETLIEINYLAIIFLVPIYFAYWLPTYNIFELDKLVLFKILTLILLLLTGLKLIFYFQAPKLSKENRKNIGVIFKRYFLIPLIFIAGLAFSLLFSIDPLKSFLGSYDRQQGLLSYLFYFLWFVLLLINLSSGNQELNKRKIKRLIITAVISGSFVALYGILQILNIDFFQWTESPFITHRTISSFGQPNFLASYLLLIIPLSVYLIINSRKLLRRFFYSLALTFQLLCLFFTSSRGAFFALILIVLGILIFFWSKMRLGIYKKILLVISLLLIIFFGLFGLDKFSNGRVSSLVDFKYGSSAVRLTFYKVALDAFKKEPLFGYGLENGSEIFIKYYHPDWGVYGDVGATTDRAHNLILDILLSSGLFGLILFSLLYYEFFYLIKRNLKSEGLNSVSLFFGLSALAYLLSLMFSFTIVGGEVYLFAYLAILISLSLRKDLSSSNLLSENKSVLNDSDKPDFKKTKFTYYFSALAFLFLSGLVFLGINRELRIIKADYYFSRIYYSLAQQDYPLTFTLEKKLLAQKTDVINRDFYDRFLAEKLGRFYPGITDLNDQKNVRQEMIRIELELRPIGYENILALAQVSGALGDLKSNRQYFSFLKEISPAWVLAYSNEAQLLFTNGYYQEAIADYNLALLNLPQATDPRFENNNDGHRADVRSYYYVFNREIANSYFKLGDYQPAENYYQQAYKYDPADFTLFKKIADCYFLRGDLDSALIYNQRGYDRNPKDYSWPLSIALLYKDKGDSVKALEYLNQALILAPDNDELKKLKLEYK